MISFNKISWLVLLFAPLSSLSQLCDITVSATPNPVACGGCVSLSAYGSGTGNIAFQEDFDSGTPTGWGFTQTADYTNPCSPGGVNGTPHMWMGDASVNPRDMETVGMDLTLGGTICFDMLFATQGDASPCEGPDEPDEGVYLQYSTDGGATWITINYFDPNGGNDPQLTNWNNYCFALPPGALTTNTMIRWHQDAVSGAEFDHWGIDNVVITLDDPNYEVSWLHDGYSFGQGSGGGVNPNQVCLTNDSTFTAQVSDGVNTCTSSVTITVTLPIVQVTAGSDTSVCAGECVNLDGFASVVVSPASTPTLENNETNVITGTPMLPTLLPCANFGGCTCWDGSSVGFGTNCPPEPGEINASMNINVQNLNTTSVFNGFITGVCISSFSINPGFGCTATSLADVEVVLICPGGTEIVLVTIGTLTGNSVSNMCFQPGGINYATASAPYSGTFAPANPFSGLNGCPVDGNWTLEIRGPNFETCIPVGAVDGWTITFDDPEISYTPTVAWTPSTNMTGGTTLTPNVCPTTGTTYTLTASDTAGCVTVSDAVTISIAATCCELLIDSTTTTDPSCGLSNGTISIFSIGNQGVVNYSIDNGATFQTSSTFPNLSTGIYDIVVQDDSCILNQQITLSSQSGPTISQVITTDPSCGNSDGEIDIQASGGTGGLSYSIDNGVSFQAGGQFAVLPAGSYDIIVVDAQGCQALSQISLNNSAAPVIDLVTITDPLCGSTNGEIEINASGGNGIIEYSIDNGATFQSGVNLFSNLADGIYTIVIQDANGCVANDAAVLNSSQGVIIDGITISDPSCGVQNGSISIQASGGTSPFSFSIDGGTTTQTTSLFGGLESSSYTVWVEDANGCFTDSTVTLNSSGGPTIDNTTVIDPSCGLSDGSIDILASGGAGTLLYSINNGTSFQGGTNFTSLPSGNYTVVIQDANMCESSIPVSLNNFPGPIIDSIITVDPTCGNSDGEMDVFAIGTATLQYSINNGASFVSTSLFTNSNVGVYDIIVVDGNGCLAAQQITLNNIAAPSIDNLIVLNPICGNNNGEIEVIASGTATLQYSINGSVPSTNSVFSNLGGGNFTILVTDGSGCQISTQQSLTFIAGPTIDSISVVNPNCAGNNDGSALVNVSSGTPAFQYSIDGGGLQSSNSFIGLSNGTYNILVVDQNNCQSTLDFTITEPPLLYMDFTPVNANCFGICDGSALAFPQGGTSATGAYLYSWSNGIAGVTDAQANNICAGSYTLSVSDDNGCILDTNFVISQPMELVIDNIQTSNEICYQDCQGSITINASLGNSFSIDGGLNFSTSTMYDSLCPGDYSIIVLDTNGCSSSDIASVEAAEELVASFLNDSISITTFNSTVNFTNTSIGGISYDWSFGGVGASNQENPTFTFPEGQADDYSVCLTIVNANSCLASVCELIIVEPEFFFYVPNTFTPDNDGINDYFFADGLGLNEWGFELLIFNRWGQLIFETNDSMDKWNGTHKGKQSPQDAYVWKIRIQHPDYVEDQTYIGHVNLIR